MFVQKKFSHAFGRRDFMAGSFVRLNVSVIKKGFAILDAGKRIANIRFAGADRFYFGAFELDTGLVSLEYVKIAQRLAIGIDSAAITCRRVPATLARLSRRQPIPATIRRQVCRR